MIPHHSAFITQHFLEGIRLFNEQAFWHAHEQWETCWRESVEPESTFYKGIIQTAAALVHWQRGNPRGLWRNWFKARPKLIALPATMQGIDIQALIAAMDRFVLTGGEQATVPQVVYRPQKLP
ncbi:MAG TPA: DUF309 domain-containing protein [Roseiflexaceae bacterium]|nr:DUF309 domain-containing protein [Roseiflexaceae bacterium]